MIGVTVESTPRPRALFHAGRKKILWNILAFRGVFIVGDYLSSFAECVLGCHASLYRYARSLCGALSEAEELLRAKLKSGYLRDPKVTVEIVNFRRVLDTRA